MWAGAIGIRSKNRLINGMHCHPSLVLLVLLVAATKIHFEKRALVVGTKQGRQADTAVRPAYFVLFPLLTLPLPSGFLTN
jgi:hypothetical protein